MVNQPADHNEISLAAFLGKATQDEMTRKAPRGSAMLFGGNKIAENPVCTINGSRSQRVPLKEEENKLARFEQSILPHMNAAYNVARWLSGNDSDAQDIVQEAYLRAFRFFSGFRGENSRAWLLRIVRNAFYDWLKQNRGEQTSEPFDEEIHDSPDETQNPDALLLEKADHELLHKTISSLPVEFREILVLRELEDFSYKEISEVANIPIGTVMSRLARGREQLRALLMASFQPK